jgi:hypothetical protein
MSTSTEEYPLVTDEDLARIAELRLCIAANQAARAHQRNAITQRHCTQRIAAAQDELQTLEFLVDLAAR